MKRLLILILILSCLLSGCGQKNQGPYRYTDYTLFDTVTTILGYGESEAVFEEQAQKICAELQTYHRLFNIYEEYDGLANLKTVNDRAGIAPVRVEQPILDLLQSCEDYYVITDHMVNVGMGSLLSLWHDARLQAMETPDRAEIPEADLRIRAQKHMDLNNMELDLEGKTVFLRDPEMRLDVGAVAKGWAAQKVSQHAPAGMLISVGGNVCASGPKPDGSPWVVGIQNPDGEGYLNTVELRRGAVVTSGDYQRYFEAEGKRYHHIIDPRSTFPGGEWRSVTVMAEDSALADALSTALFLLPQDRGQQLLDAVGAQGVWLSKEGELLYSRDFPDR